MLRLTLLLSAALFTTLLIAGEDRGQMRPRLAEARANGAEIVTLRRSFSAPVAVVADAAPAPGSLSALPPPVEMIAAPEIGTLPSPAAEEEAPAPVFTLSTLQGLGGDQARLPEPPAPATTEDSGSLYADPSDGGRLSAGQAEMFGAETTGAVADTGAELSADPYAADPYRSGGDDLRMVQGRTVNVRLGPSTDTAVVGRLDEGEVVRVIGGVDADWVEIAIEGDGLRGYVAARLLLPLNM